MINEVSAYIQSLRNPRTGITSRDEAIIHKHINNNYVICEYKGVKCHGIYNPFTKTYYLHDVTGKLADVEIDCE